MRRTLLTLFAFTALAAWAGAQGTPLPAAVQIKQFKNNRYLIEFLVDHGIELGNAESPLQRAAACQKTAGTLARHLSLAAEKEDADRIAELATLYTEVIREGIVPNLQDATRTIDPQSPDAERLKSVRDTAARDFNGVRNSIPTEGPLGDNEKVKAALQSLDRLKSAFAQP